MPPRARIRFATSDMCSISSTATLMITAPAWLAKVWISSIRAGVVPLGKSVGVRLIE